MIKVVVYTQKDGKISGLDVEGHAKQGPVGKDIYCAGISILTHSTYIGITEHLKRRVKTDFDNGKFSLFLVDPPDRLTDAVLQTAILGILEIKKLIPKAIEVNYVSR